MNYTIIITKSAGLFTLWIDKEKHARSSTQCKCSRRSACHTCGAIIDFFARAYVGLLLHVDKEKPHNSCLFCDDQSIVLLVGPVTFSVTYRRFFLSALHKHQIEKPLTCCDIDNDSRWITETAHVFEYFHKSCIVYPRMNAAISFTRAISGAKGLNFLNIIHKSCIISNNMYLW